MLIDHKREKLINAIIYFVTNTKYCGKVKLFKLLYFLDFEHYAQTGRSVTGLDYHAWPKGPVPVDLFNEIDQSGNDLKDAMEIKERKIAKGKMLRMIPKRPFSREHFTRRELRLLEQLGKEYADSNAEEIVEVTHLENSPWHEIYEVTGKKQTVIPYELALKKSEYEKIMKNITDNKEFEENYA
uniref:Antitoxin SocA-like Panacea domain-containing protein n=1 Tax=Candidatus Kentrum sp. FW TaxID=2126338 RepID=A0A450TTL6_9GAMM|nr:MAG: Protein of unknown function (DUF4065) [Candidatus Kentron sp. FW]